MADHPRVLEPCLIRFSLDLSPEFGGWFAGDADDEEVTEDESGEFGCGRGEAVDDDGGEGVVDVVGFGKVRVGGWWGEDDFLGGVSESGRGFGGFGFDE